MSLIDLQLVKRLTKGSPLTVQEMDDNLCAINDVLQALADLLTSVIGDDGKLAACSVDTISLCDRVVTQAKRAWGSDFVANDTGAVDTVEISFTPAITAYSTSALVAAKIAADNTGAATLSINGVGATPIKKNGTDDLEATDLKADKIALFAYDGTNFQLLNPTKLQQGAILTYEGEALTALSTGSTNNESFTHGLIDELGAAVVPTGYEVSLVCQSADLGFSEGDHIPISQVIGNYVTDDEAPISVTVNDTSIAVQVELGIGWTLLAKPQPTLPDGATVAIDPTKWKVAAKAWYFSSAGAIPIFNAPSVPSGGGTSNVTKLTKLIDVPNEGSSTSWTHGQTDVPDIVQVRLVVDNLTAIPGGINHLAVGDEVEFRIDSQDNAASTTQIAAAKALIINSADITYASPKADTTGGPEGIVIHGSDGSANLYTCAQVQANFKLKFIAVWVS